MAGTADDLYRPCVGIAVFNHEGLVLLGRRSFGAESGEPVHAWQMPQGGIDQGETPLEAARRELYEETSIHSATLLGENEAWLTYDIPKPLAGMAWKGRYRGQRQKWLAFRFVGEEAEIDVEHPGGGKHKPEFEAWRWERLERVPELIVPFKRAVYDTVVEAFSHYAQPTPGASKAQR